MDNSQLFLTSHPDTPAGSIIGVNAAITRTRRSINILYVIEGPTDKLALPKPAKPCRTEGLWQTTCVEFFMRDSCEGYSEFNFSPSSQWAAYDFSSYREGMTPKTLDYPPRLSFFDEGYALLLGVYLELPMQEAVSVNLSAVIEETDGTKSYWALAHPPGEPDFHHPDCFALELPAPSAA